MMVPLALSLVVLFAGSCYGATQRIVGGETTDIQAYPSLVQVDFLNPWSNSWSQNCAGNVLNEVYVLSAAHCFEGVNYNPNQRRIRAGTSYRNTGGVIVNVFQEFNHPNYRVASRWDSDITVVRLLGALNFIPTIQQAVILHPDSVIVDNVPLTAAGWGITEVGEDFSHFLQDTTVYTINQNTCRSRYETWSPSAVVTSNMICTGRLGVGGRDHCQGDAGGALYYENIVVAVMSWGYACGGSYFPGVNTAVAPFVSWINATAV